jgi:glutaredoxin
MHRTVATGLLLARLAFGLLTTLAFGLLLSSLSACRDAKPAHDAVRASQLPAIEVRAKSKLLLTYYDAAKQSFETVTELSKVPTGQRGWVRVVDLTLEPGQRQDRTLVYVADLRQAGKNGTFPYVVMSRVAFEAAAQAGIRPGATAPASAPAGGTAVVLYGTSWCPACRAAKKWLQNNRVPFVEKDIEKDRAAAAELMAKAQRAGISTSGVPVLDVRGTLMQGFDPRRVAAVLGAKK